MEASELRPVEEKEPVVWRFVGWVFLGRRNNQHKGYELWEKLCVWDQRKGQCDWGIVREEWLAKVWKGRQEPHHETWFSSVQSLSHVWLAHLCPVDFRTPGLPVHLQLPKFVQTHIYLVSDAIQPSHPLSSPSPPAFNFYSIRVFSNESALHSRWSKY